MPSITGGGLVDSMLAAEGVEVVFGIIDGTYFGLYAAFEEHGIRLVGPRHEIADRLRARLRGIADGVSLTHNRAPDPAHWADVVRDLRS